jgi:DNA-binding GntR family transcriptional regulator
MADRNENKDEGMGKIIFKKQAYSLLKDKLVNCDYRPGTWLNEARLVEELGCSRTPIREALTMIEQEGFIRIMPKKGIFVTEIALNDVKQIFQTRKEIEPATLRMAAPKLPREKLEDFRNRFLAATPEIKSAFRLDTAMHLFIIEHCGNRFIIDMMCKVFEENTRIIISSKQNEVEIHDARTEHVEILDLLTAGKIETAAAAMLEHVRHCERAALEFFYNSSSFSDADEIKYMYQDSLERLNPA